MDRRTFLGCVLIFLTVGMASAQFVRPPVVPARPPTPVVPRPILIPTQPPSAFQRPHAATPVTPTRPLQVIPPNPGMLAVLGGCHAARTAIPSAPPVSLAVTPPRLEVNWPATLAVIGTAGVPEDSGPPLIFVLTPVPPRPVNDDAGWVPWAIGSGVCLAAVGGLAVVLRPRGGRVRVFDIPPGEAPDWVRRAWVGIELPTQNRIPKPIEVIQMSTGEPAGEWVGYAVSGIAALAAVAAVNPGAAEWWRSNLPAITTPGYKLIFPADVCERLK